jgi:hypothetical protein
MKRFISIYLLGSILLFGQSLKEIDENPSLVDNLSNEEIEKVVDKISLYRYNFDVISLTNSVTQILYNRRPKLKGKLDSELEIGRKKYQNKAKSAQYSPKRSKKIFSQNEIEKTGLKKKVVKDIIKNYSGNLRSALTSYSYKLDKNFPEVYNAAQKLGIPLSEIKDFLIGYNKRLEQRRAKRVAVWTAIAAGVAQGADNYANSLNNSQKSSYIATPATTKQYSNYQGQVSKSSSQNSYSSFDNSVYEDSSINSSNFSNSNATYTDPYGMTTGYTEVQEDYNGNLKATHKDEYGMTSGYSNTSKDYNGNVNIQNTDNYGMTTGYSKVSKTNNGEYLQTHKDEYGMNTGYSETKSYNGYKMITHKDQYGMTKGYTKVYDSGIFETTDNYGMIISRGKID